MDRANRHPRLTEEQLDRLAGLTLISGSTLSFIFMAFGLVLMGGGPFPGRFVAQSPQDVIAGASHLDPLSLVNLGILVLMATPVLRVIIAIIGFALEPRWRFVGVSSAVLTMLIISLLVANR